MVFPPKNCTIYFEGEYPRAALLEYGYSHDNQPDCKPVNLRLNVTSDDEIQFAFKVVSGNAADRTTSIENMYALRDVLKGMKKSDELIVASDWTGDGGIIPVNPIVVNYFFQ